MKSQSQLDRNDISIKKKVLSFPTLMSFLIGGVLIYFLSSRFNLDWSQMFSHIKEMNIFSYVCALFLYYVSFVFRGVRWRVLGLNASRKLVENSELSFRTPPIYECSPDSEWMVCKLHSLVTHGRCVQSLCFWV